VDWNRFYAVRSLPHRRNIPIIMLSGDECEKEAWRAGADDFLRKADAVNELVSRITRVVQKGRKEVSKRVFA